MDSCCGSPQAPPSSHSKARLLIRLFQDLSIFLCPYFRNGTMTPSSYARAKKSSHYLGSYFSLHLLLSISYHIPVNPPTPVTPLFPSFPYHWGKPLLLLAHLWQRTLEGLLLLLSLTGVLPWSALYCHWLRASSCSSMLPKISDKVHAPSVNHMTLPD